MIRLISLLFLSFLALIPIRAQQIDHVQGELLVQLSANLSVRDWYKDFQRQHPAYPIQLKRCVVRSSNIWLLTFDYHTINENRLLALVNQQASIVHAQLNHLVELRATIPNDPEFNQQWQYINTGQTDGTPNADLDAELAWDFTVGGLSAMGDTIVVCVIDNGIDIDHPDLLPNLWINHAEIPDNGLDDDGNGFVDDYEGWSVGTNNDDIEGGSHGTSVTGIVGARGNNNIGVSGVNWNVKLMLVRNDFNTDEADVLEAYSYPLEQRKRYNATNGAEGAFVVVTNASWGADNLFPEDAPLWCSFYDTLGVHGIINVGATTNSNIDVDIAGDLPTTCTSDFLISVTNLDANNNKVPNAGFGSISIDIGAYGDRVWTTQNGGYGPFPGTSAAAPHVAGAIGLLYAADCPDFIQTAKQSPSTGALLAKQFILDSAVPTPAIQNTTLTGGRLNLFNVLQETLANCGACLDPSDLDVNSSTENSATLSWVQFNNHTRIDLRWRAVGAPFWNNIQEVSAPLELTDLTACTDYEFQLKGYCAGEELAFTPSLEFLTEGCCDIPADIVMSDINFESAILDWSPVPVANSYTVRFRQNPTDTWTQFTTISTFFPLINLMPCTDYQLQVRTNCAGSISDFSPIINFNTLGCGGCLDLPYCTDFDLDADEEWIESVRIHTLTNMSGNDDGYGDYTDFAPLQLDVGQSYSIALEPGHSGMMWAEYFLIWIDFNQNGTFQSSEVIFDPGNSFNQTVNGTISIPANAPLGNTRLRVGMQFLSAGGPCFFSEGLGEVEDYCVNIIDPNACDPPTMLTRTDASPTTLSLEWPDVPNAESYLFRYRPTATTAWTSLTAADNTLSLNDLDTCATFEVSIQSNC
ncbi:MAG: S8 family serine peptidase, partial [Bacteroidota bacterium]